LIGVGKNMITNLIDRSRPEFEKAIEHFKNELTQLRTGRASSALVENVMVDYYGSKSPLKQIASISTPEPRLILISPWSKDTLVNIEKSIRDSQLNLNPVNDGQVLRVNIPPLNEERRRELVKILSQKAEEARVTVRKQRENIWDEIQDFEKQGKIAEDDKFSGKDRLQKVVDEYNGKIEEIREKKEEEIMTV
jgi:ribosome recycling factor